MCNSHHEYEQDEGKIIPFPAKKNEASSGDLPSVAGRYYLVPREILLPLPGTRTLLREEACIPVSEQAGGTHQASDQKSTPRSAMK